MGQNTRAFTDLHQSALMHFFFNFKIISHYKNRRVKYISNLIKQILNLAVKFA